MPSEILEGTAELESWVAQSIGHMEQAKAHCTISMQAIGAGAEDPYAGFNVLMRRKPKENNFKAVLESIRDLMNEVAIMPDWLEKVFLGYGDPAAAMYQNLPNQLRTIDFKVQTPSCQRCSAECNAAGYNGKHDFSKAAHVYCPIGHGESAHHLHMPF